MITIKKLRQRRRPEFANKPLTTIEAHRAAYEDIMDQTRIYSTSKTAEGVVRISTGQFVVEVDAATIRHLAKYIED